MHILLVKLTENGLESYQYVNSKFERELGEKMRYEGVTMTVGAIGDSREVVLKYGEKIMRKQMKIDRAKFLKSHTVINEKPLLFDDEFLNQLYNDIKM